MNQSSTYTRTISEEEAAEGYLMVLKDQLAFFPLVGTEFELQSANRRLRANVEKYHCECRGPEKSHDHYFIRHEGLKKGDTVVLRKDEKKSGRYFVSIRSIGAKKELCG